MAATSREGPPTRTLLAAALIGTGGTLVTVAFGLVRAKVLAVELDPGGLGLYGQIFTLLTIMSAVTGLGLGLGTTKFVAAARARDDRSQLALALNVSLGIPAVIALVGALAIAAASTGLAPLLLDDDRVILILVAAAAVPFVAMQGPLIHALQGFRDVKGAQLASVVFATVLTVATAIGAVVGGLDGAVVAFLAAAVVYTGVLLWRLRQTVALYAISLRPLQGISKAAITNPAMRGMLAIGFASLFVSVVVGLGQIVVRTLLLKTFDDAAAGIYQALTMLSTQFIGVIVVAVAFFSFTTVSEAEAIDDRSEAARRTDDAVRLGLLLTVPLVTLVALLRDELVPLLLSSAFEPMVRELPLALTSDLLRVVAWIAGASLIPLGLTRRWVAISLGQFFVFVGLSVWLVPDHGVRGTMIATVAMWAVAAVATVLVLARADALSPSRRTVALLALLPGVVALLFLGPPGVGLAVAIALAVGVVLLVVGTDREERIALLNTVRRYLSRGAH